MSLDAVLTLVSLVCDVISLALLSVALLFGIERAVIVVNGIRRRIRFTRAVARGLAFALLAGIVLAWGPLTDILFTDLIFPDGPLSTFTSAFTSAFIAFLKFAVLPILGVWAALSAIVWFLLWLIRGNTERRLAWIGVAFFLAGLGLQGMAAVLGDEPAILVLPMPPR